MVKAKIKYASCIILVYIFQIIFIPFSKVYASPISSNMDVVFVLDSSGSMKESDPEEIRTEAIKMFLDMGQIQGNKAGLVAYSDNIVREHNLDNMNSTEDKNRIKTMASGIPLGQKTDTGYGLIEGTKLLDSGHDKSHQPLIILLSDGKNDPKRSAQESLNDLNNALSICKSKGYPVYTIGLNYDGTVDKNQLSEISNSTNGKSYITNTAADLPKILTDIYADNSKLKIQDGGSIIGNGDFQDLKVDIPNSNVLEANISMLSDKPVELKLINPSGKEIPIPSANAVFTSSQKYSMLKIVKPVEGQWTVRVKGVNGSNIKVSYIFNYDLQIEASINPQKPNNGDKISIEAYFISNGQKISDKELYNNMKAKLIVKNLKDNSIKEIALTTGEGVFRGEYQIPSDGKYEVKVRVDGNSFYRESTPIVIGNSSTKASIDSTSKKGVFQNPIILYSIGGVLAAIVLFLIYFLMKKKNILGFGRVELQIRDENTKELLPPQFRNLDGYRGSFTLFDVLGLKEEYGETENIRFIFNNDDSIDVINKSECVIQRSGKKLDNDSKVVLYDKNKITIFLTKVPKSIVMQFNVK
ncbi:VWA domain-containing protein [Clostridiaceae bacterium UIB06]|uniref:VWA domain-containing protein n=1 Tax=Clostridium thailandense TaxID=2794346 RepID=A0A949WQS8_9CLOT|nr:vWA domain-containing protein [Clostridium thailandense]MBV7273140.1 VWA domain-containing protein [Clostridium thailandense]MCH5137534.1 VWA domain-containing protein [Clostridiaceae bacterium UIB06]